MQLDALDQIAAKAFEGFLVRKDLVRKVKVGANVPVFVLEYLLGKYCATDDPVAIDAGLKVVNNTEYGLTGSIYSTDREKLDRARSEFHVGNLYFNRKCTGAMVGAHPFGGFNMSGTDSKAGGPEYLLLFTQAKSVAEKL